MAIDPFDVFISEVSPSILLGLCQGTILSRADRIASKEQGFSPCKLRVLRG
jgi:hypothetical protein